jgi:magnesium-transporting ATPase (P-type)
LIALLLKIGLEKSKIYLFLITIHLIIVCLCIVFVSPLNRTLETVPFAIKNQKKGYRKVVVLTDLIEVMKTFVILSYNIIKIQKYPNLDFTYINEQVIQEHSKH